MISRTFPIRTLFLIAAAAMSAMLSPSLLAQAHQPAHGIDVAVTYAAERAKIASVDCGCFWLQGGSGNVAYSFFRGLGVAADVTGGHSANIADGVGLDKITFTAGPRYTFNLESRSRQAMGKNHETSLFGEGLFGVARGFNSVFPTSSGTKDTASSFALELGGGVNLSLTPTIGIRALEISYIRTTLPNNASDTQNDLRLGAGINFHFHFR